jgi:hypothetical protein
MPVEKCVKELSSWSADNRGFLEDFRATFHSDPVLLSTMKNFKQVRNHEPENCSRQLKSNNSWQTSTRAGFPRNSSAEQDLAEKLVGRKMTAGQDSELPHESIESHESNRHEFLFVLPTVKIFA